MIQVICFGLLHRHGYSALAVMCIEIFYSQLLKTLGQFKHDVILPCALNAECLLIINCHVLLENDFRSRH